MGGQGSGRKPDIVRKILNDLHTEKKVPIISKGNEGIFLPNLSGVKKEALKTDPTTLGGGITGTGSDKKIPIWNGTSGLTYDADMYFNANVLYTPEINNYGPIFTDDLIFGGFIQDTNQDFTYDGVLTYTTHPMHIDTSEILDGTTDATFRISSPDTNVAACMQFDGSYAKMEFGSTTASTDQGNYQFYVNPYGQWIFGMLNDAKDAENTFMVFNRTGYSPDNVIFYVPYLQCTGSVRADTYFDCNGTAGYTGTLRDSASNAIAEVAGGIITTVYY